MYQRASLQSNGTSVRSYDTLISEYGGSRLSSRVAQRGSTTSTPKSPDKSPLQPLSPFRMPLMSKDSSFGRKRSTMNHLTSGIKSWNENMQENRGRQKSLYGTKDKPIQNVERKNSQRANLRPLKEDKKKILRSDQLEIKDKKGINRDKNQEIKDEKNVVGQSRRKSSITHISLGDRRRIEKDSSVEALRLATTKNIFQVDEDSFDMNDEGVSFSLSSRIQRRQEIILDEENSISREASVSLNDGHRRKFKNMSKILNTISIVHGIEEEQPSKTSPSDSALKSNDLTQTSTYSANVLEDSNSKKIGKAFAATVVKKPLSKPESNNIFKPAPPGVYMGIMIHPKLTCAPFPLSSKNQILFGPYENSLLEVEESLCIHHLFHNLDYYYMPNDPIRKSLLDPKRFAYAIEPIYNDKHVATEVLTMLPMKRN